MTLSERIVGRREPAAPQPQSAPAPAAAPAATSEELDRRRTALARRFADLQWDLGGIAYEMASRDHFRLDVLARQAAKLQEVDAELAGVERLIRLGEAGAAGSCPSCGALYSRGAGFCWSCGVTLIEQGPATANGDAGVGDRP